MTGLAPPSRRYLALVNPKKPSISYQANPTVFTDSLVVPLPSFITPPTPPGCPGFDFHTTNLLGILVKEVVHGTPRILVDRPELLSPSNSGNSVRPGSCSGGVDRRSIERTSVIDQRLFSEPPSLPYGSAGDSAIVPGITNGNAVISVAVRAVATVLLLVVLVARVFMGLTETGDLGPLDNLVDRGIFEAAKRTAGRDGVVGVGVVRSATNTSDFSLFDNGATIGVERRVVVSMAVATRILEGLADTGNLGLLDDSATVSAKGGITKVAAGFAVTVAVAAVAIVRVAMVTTVVEVLADAGDLSLLDDGVAAAIVDYSVVTETVVVAVTND